MLQPGIRIFLIAIMVLSSLLSLNGQAVLINEFMSVNETTLADFEGDYPDWIEIYNHSSDTATMLGYGLSDDPLLPGKWSFPDISLPPQGYLLIFASGKDKAVKEEFHANFKISGSGEVVILSNEKGTVIDRVAPQSLEADKVFGRLPDGSDQWTRMLYPTPGKPNMDWNDIRSSHPGGFYLKPFNLSLSSANGDSIRFRMDGKEPAYGDAIYKETLLINGNSGMPAYLSGVPSSPPQTLINYKAWESPAQVDRIQVIRYATFKGSRRTSKVYTASYLVGKRIMDRYSMPVISLQSDPDNLTRYDSGIYIPGVHFDDADPQWTGNYFQSGREWEKPVHMAFFDSDGSPGFSLDAGVRIHGMMT